MAHNASSIYIVEEGTAGGTWGAEVAAALARTLPGLKAPVRLIHSADAIIPSARHLERGVLVQSEDIVDRIATEHFHAAHRRSHN